MDELSKNKQEPPQRNNENSGIHDLRALAQATKQRVTRETGRVELIDESLLLSASSQSLSQVAMPKAGQTGQLLKTGMVAKVEFTPAESSSNRLAVHSNPSNAMSAVDYSSRHEPSKGKSPWIWMAVGAVVAAGAASAFVVMNRKEQATESSEVASLASKGGKESDAPQVEPVAAKPVEAGSEILAAPLPPKSEEAAIADKTEPAIAKAEPKAVAAEAKKSVEAKALTDAKLEAKLDAKTKEAKKTEEAKAGTDAEPSEAAALPSKAEAQAVAPAKVETKGSGDDSGKSVDDLLNEVVNGAPTEVAAPKEDKPSKKSLERKDVSDAMADIREPARKCFSVEQVAGSVTVKFVVGSSGKVTSSDAQGSFAGTPTGKCVAQAVSKAKFPAFDGNPMTFSFPFLLSE